MLRQTALRRLVEFARRHRVDLPSQAVACANPHRRRVARDPTQSFGTSAYRRFNRFRMTKGGRQQNDRFGEGRPKKRTTCYRPNPAVQTAIMVAQKRT